MPKKYFKGKKGVRKGRRRLGGTGSGRKSRYGALAGTAVNLAPRLVEGVRRARAYAQGRKYYSPAQRARMRTEDLSVSDNITNLPLTVIGKPRKPSFAEKVARVERPPVLFKRNYQFSAECVSGRKAWFNMGINHNTNDVGTDLGSYKTNLTTDTTTAEASATASDIYDKGRFYVDYLSTKLQFMNSGTNAMTGKIHVFAYSRDAKSQYNGVPINPVNMMMYYSAYGRALQYTNQEILVGSGWNFDTTTANYNYTSNYNMPGSSVNSGGVCAFTDLALSPSSTHVKQDMAFWFKKVSTQSFSLKPGQQVNKIIKFHDLPTIARELMDHEFFGGISYAIAVEFQGQVVGDSSVANVISTGGAQLSVIREDIRILGLKNALKPKVLLQTVALSTILKANTVIINPDTGAQTTGGYQDDA